MSSYPGGRLSGLLTDLYELTMAAGYVQKHFEARATFELFVRHLPPHRNYLVAAGLEQALHFLESVHFSSEDISYLHSLPLFVMLTAAFLNFLRDSASLATSGRCPRARSSSPANLYCA